MASSATSAPAVPKLAARHPLLVRFSAACCPQDSSSPKNSQIPSRVLFPACCAEIAPPAVSSKGQNLRSVQALTRPVGRRWIPRWPRCAGRAARRAMPEREERRKKELPLFLEPPKNKNAGRREREMEPMATEDFQLIVRANSFCCLPTNQSLSVCSTQWQWLMR